MGTLSFSWPHLVFAVLLCLAVGCGDAESPSSGSGKASDDMARITGAPGKVLMVIAPQNFRDEELLAPRAALEKAGFTVELASTKREVCKGMLGAEAHPDLILGEVKPADYQAVVFVGGSGTSVLFDDRVAHRVASTAYENGALVGAICIAPVILAEAGLLEGRKISVWRSMADVCEAKGARVTGDEVTRHGRIVTGNGPKASEAFGKALVDALQ